MYAGGDRSNERLTLASTCVLSWCALTALVFLSTALVYAIGGRNSLRCIIQNGPFSDLGLTALSVFTSWLLVGVLALGIRFAFITRKNAISWAGFFVVALLYISFLRERTDYGDWPAYWRAAINLRLGQHLHARYLYPPLWAALWEPMVPLGLHACFYLCWLANVFGLLLSYALIHKVLQRYGFSQRSAALATTVFMLVNTPIVRTLGYTQVNIHVMNLVLLSMILYPRRRGLSAVALALAVHLKASPALLVVAFLLEKDLRWLLWFALSATAIFGATVALHGISPYYDWIYNFRHIYIANGQTFRDNSIDSCLRGVCLLPRCAGARPVVGCLHNCQDSAGGAVRVGCCPVRQTPRVPCGAERGGEALQFYRCPVYSDDSSLAAGLGASWGVLRSTILADLKVPVDSPGMGSLRVRVLPGVPSAHI